MKNRKGKGALLRRGFLLFCVAVMGFCMNMGFATPWMASATEASGSDVEMVRLSEVEIESDGSDVEEVIEKVGADDGLVLFALDEAEADSTGASGSGSESDCDRTVTFGYDERLAYEDYHTHEFNVTYSGKTKVAYCVQPEKKLMTEGEKESSVHDSELIKKALYYSYGYPGYEKKMKDYLKGIEREACYKGENGAYILSHLMLSAIYQDEGGDCDAYKGVGDDTIKIVKGMIKNVKTWDAPPVSSKISLSNRNPAVLWDTDLGMQRTEDMKVTGADGNSIDVAIPEGGSLIRLAEDGKEETFENKGDKAKEKVRVSVGESFSLVQEPDVEGNYESPKMKGNVSAFEAYIILSDLEQDIVYGLELSNSTSFSVNWGSFWSDNIKISTSATEEKTNGKEFYADGETVIVDDVYYDGLAPGLEYVLKGQLMDKATGEALEGCQAEAVFTPDNDCGNVLVKFTVNGDALAGKSVVAFERLYYGDKLLAVHEDIEDADQTVTVLEKEETPEPEPEPEPDTPDTPDTPDAPTDTKNEKPVAKTVKKITTDSGVSTVTKGSGSSSSPKTGDEVPLGALLMAIMAAIAIGTVSSVRKL